MRPLLFALFALIVSGPALATGSPVAAAAGSAVVGSATAAPTASASRAASDKDIKVCRMVKEIGSNRATRICKTKAQIELESETARGRLNGPAGDKSF